MKKSVVIILAVAIIGALGFVAKNHKDGAALAPPASNSSGTMGAATNVSSASNMNSGMSNMPGNYKDGTYNGQSEDTPYGIVQVAVVVSGGKITDIKFLQMPYDLGHSQQVTSYAEPYLKDETIQRQSANIDFVSGASTTSEAYQLSLQAALDKAVVS